MNLTSLTSQELIKRVSSYMLYLQQARSRGVSLNHTILMDEMAVYLEDPSCIMVYEAGKRHVLLHSTGFVSLRIMVLLSRLSVRKEITTSDNLQEVGRIWYLL